MLDFRQLSKSCDCCGVGSACFPRPATPSTTEVGIKHDFHGSLPRMFKLYDIFKDADALDRWRLGNGGLDPKYLRTEQAKTMVDYSHRIVNETIPQD